MPAYLFYTIEKEKVINLAKKFNEFRNRAQIEYITLSEFISYSDMYLEAASKRMIGFDYDLYGSVLLNTKVVFSNAKDKEEYNKIIRAIYICLHQYSAYRRNEKNVVINNTQCIRCIDMINDVEDSNLDKEDFSYEKKI